VNGIQGRTEFRRIGLGRRRIGGEWIAHHAFGLEGSSVDHFWLDATEPRRASRMGWRCRRPGTVAGSTLDSPFSRVGGGVSRKRPRLASGLQGAWRELHSAAGRWLGCGGFFCGLLRISLVERIDAMAMDPARLKAWQMASLDPDGQGRDQFAQWSPVSRRRGEGPGPEGEREGHGGTQLSLRSACDQEEQPRSQHCRTSRRGAC